MEIAKLGYSDTICITRLEEFNQGMIELYKGKRYATKAMQTKSKDEWKNSFVGFKNAKAMGNNLYNLLKSDSTESIEHEKSRITSSGTEIKCRFWKGRLAEILVNQKKKLCMSGKSSTKNILLKFLNFVFCEVKRRQRH